jgi:hypothetical protein
MMDMKPYGCLKVALLLLLAAGCATPPAHIPSKPRPPITSMDWVAMGSGAFEIAGEAVFCGVGRASGTANAILLRAAADNRAKDELAKVLKAYAAFLADTYLAQNKAAGGASAAQGQMLKETAAALAESSLSQAVIVDHRQANGAFASLCRMKLSDFKDLIVDDLGLEHGFRAFCRDRAESLHASFSRAKRS